MIQGLVRLDKFAAAQTPYALDRGSFHINQWGLAAVNAIWAGRKNKRTTASIGHLTACGAATVEEFIDTIDMRYGGDYEGRWDGQVLITQNPSIEPRRGEIITILTTALDAFPAVPDGYDGWYYTRKDNR